MLVAGCLSKYLTNRPSSSTSTEHFPPAQENKKEKKERSHTSASSFRSESFSIFNRYHAMREFSSGYVHRSTEDTTRDVG